MFREQDSNHLQWPDLALSRHLTCIEWINDRVEEIKIQMRTGRTHTEIDPLLSLLFSFLLCLSAKCFVSTYLMPPA